MVLNVLTLRQAFGSLTAIGPVMVTSPVQAPLKKHSLSLGISQVESPDVQSVQEVRLKTMQLSNRLQVLRVG